MRRLAARSILSASAGRIAPYHSTARAFLCSSQPCSPRGWQDRTIPRPPRGGYTPPPSTSSPLWPRRPPPTLLHTRRLPRWRTPSYFVDNKFLASSTDKWIDLYDPATNNLVTRVPQSTDAELRAAVDSAEKAFPAWRATSVLHRQQVMFKFVALIRENWDRLAASITLEQGKTFADAKGDVLRGLQVAEAACGAPELLKGELLEVAKDMETRTYREPLGVVAAICPFSTSSSIFFFFLILCFVPGDETYTAVKRFPRNDSSLVYSHRHRDRKHPCAEASSGIPVLP